MISSAMIAAPIGRLTSRAPPGRQRRRARAGSLPWHRPRTRAHPTRAPPALWPSSDAGARPPRWSSARRSAPLDPPTLGRRDRAASEASSVATRCPGPARSKSSVFCRTTRTYRSPIWEPRTCCLPEKSPCRRDSGLRKADSGRYGSDGWTGAAGSRVSPVGGSVRRCGLKTAARLGVVGPSEGSDGLFDSVGEVGISSDGIAPSLGGRITLQVDSAPKANDRGKRERAWYSRFAPCGSPHPSASCPPTSRALGWLRETIRALRRY